MTTLSEHTAVPVAEGLFSWPGLRAAVINAILLGITVSRHLLKYDELADAEPARIIELLRPGMEALAAGDDGSA